jgi:hypothetical protein
MNSTGQPRRAPVVATQPQIIYIDTPHDGFGPMGEVQPR